LQRGHDGTICFIDAGGANHHGERSSGGQGVKEAIAPGGHSLGEVQYHEAKLSHTPSPQGIGRGHHQVVLVIPLRSQPVGHHLDDPHHGRGTRALGGHRVEGTGTDPGEVSLRRGKRQLGRGMACDRRQDARVLGEGGAHRLEDDGRRHGPETGGCQRGAAQALSQAVEGEETCPDDAISPGQLPAR
jgi:hypothetical protein